MNSINFKKGVVSLSLCLITALSLVGCASEGSRSVASPEDSVSADVKAPAYQPHGRKSERQNSAY